MAQQASPRPSALLDLPPPNTASALIHESEVVSSDVESPLGQHKVFLIGVTGGTASGKTSVCNRIITELGDQKVEILSQDSFYKGLGPGQDASEYNFDHPDAFDYDLFHACLKKITQGELVEIPMYSFKTHSRSSHVRRLVPSPVVITEGILVFYDERVRRLLNMKIFVDTDADVRLLRRMKRDIAERGRSYESVLYQYERFVKPSYDEFIAPTKKYADIIIPKWPNEVAVDLMAQHIRSKLHINDVRKIYTSLKVLPSNSQVRQLHTIIRNRRCRRTDFVFYADRIIRLVVEYALGILPFKDKVVRTPTGQEYRGIMGVEFQNKLCAVSIIRAGESMEAGLTAVCHDIRIGKILLRFKDTEDSEWNSSKDRNPDVIYLKLPQDIEDRYVLLLDPVLGRGWSVIAATRLLLARGVPEHKVIFVSLIATPEGIHNVYRHFPQIQVVTTEIDQRIDENGYALPGVGNFADRYFGTEEAQAEYIEGGVDVARSISEASQSSETLLASMGGMPMRRLSIKG